MKFNSLLLALVLAGSVSVRCAFAQSTGSLTLSDFATGASSKGWEEAADVSLNIAASAKPKITAGTGVIVFKGEGTETALTTKNSYDDTEVEFDFLVSSKATLGVLLQGLYRVNLSDSWGSTSSVTADMGGVGPLKQGGGAFTGLPPLINVAKAPGLWQHALIKFRSPKLSGGAKTGNGLFEEVYINGVLVQENAEVQGPSAGSVKDTETGSGPVVFVAANGVAAIKNLKINKLAPVITATTTPPRRMRRVPNPILLDPSGKNYLLRSFVNFNGKKRTHVVSLGSPQQVNYSYDVKQGALFQVWHGPFMDVTEMWEQRGEPQLAKPRGAVVALSEAPALAVLVDKEATIWPDSLAFDDLKNQGYTLDKQRNPTFEYEVAGYHVADKLAVGNADKSIARQITVTKAPANLYLRIARGTAITPAGNGLFVIGDKGYYVQTDEKFKPFVRYSKSGSELLVPVTSDKPVNYSIIW
ncbi:family 16 glycoside hydrolase [Mucilaginibacter auburnensis]|uniref:Uncharacterized protein DUF1080 n=1 Tax=Mucilaginibacter auburnensis TaxID=1457233 RepID=A0A2H9VNV2_9SPHI|nr:family 16 glycoside hydrolase [Mucilaginibacter auburnensis]PJJ79997.1 uncharacterized protein DUF1080 [Mucilaginibacter auburnensis]